MCQEVKGIHTESREVRVHLGAASHIAADAVALWMAAAPSRRISLSQSGSRETEPDVVVDSLPPKTCARVEKFSERMMLAAPEKPIFSLRTGAWLDELRELDFVSVIVFIRFYPDSQRNYVSPSGLLPVSRLKATIPVWFVR